MNHSVKAPITGVGASFRFFKFSVLLDVRSLSHHILEERNFSAAANISLKTKDYKFLQTLSKSAKSESSSHKLLIMCWNSPSLAGLHSPLPSMIVALKAAHERDNCLVKNSRFIMHHIQPTHAIEILLVEKSIVINICRWGENNDEIYLIVVCNENFQNAI